MKSLLLGLLICSSAFAQLEVTSTKAKSLSGAVGAKTVGDVILLPIDSKPVFSEVAIVTVESPAKFIRVRAYKSLFETAKVTRLDEKNYMLSGLPGRYAVEVTSFDPTIGIDEKSIEVVLGSNPDPIPDPVPNPPKPDPIPVPPVKNDYNVGVISFKTAPPDAAMAKQIAGWYRAGASKLYGVGKLDDIDRIKGDIDKQFAAKQCKDQVTCQQWDVWKKAIGQATVAEQNKRKMFLREDWFAAMVEIAEGLEAVK